MEIWLYIFGGNVATFPEGWDLHSIFLDAQGVGSHLAVLVKRKEG